MNDVKPGDWSNLDHLEKDIKNVLAADENMKCKKCGNDLIFNGEFTYYKEGRKFNGKDWFYCVNCNCNYEG